MNGEEWDLHRPLPDGAQVAIVTVDTDRSGPLADRTVVVRATNGVGVRNDPAAPGSYLQFIVVTPPPGAPPPAPVLNAPEPLTGGQVRVTGTSVAGARVTVSNQTTGFSVQASAGANGAFSALIDAVPGDLLRAVAFDLASSPDPSPAGQVAVPTPPQLVSLSAAPASLAFTSVGAFADLSVTGQYDNATSANLTASAAFQSTATTVATVIAGRAAGPRPGAG